jgi:transposase
MATSTTPVEFSPLPTTREERGRQIAKLGGIRLLGAAYVVPSQSDRGDAPPTYLVDVVEQTCTCPDYATRRMVCKHQEAVLFWLAWEGTVNEDTGQIELPEATRKPKRKTYPRNWPAYNAAQIEEKARVEVLLRALCEGIEQPARRPGARGRDAYSRRDAIFGCVLKVYTTFSGRRADTDISACAERGSIGKAYHPNTLFRAMEDPATTPILLRLIEESAAPLAEVENRAGQFAQDSTGISTVTYDRWFDQKHGKLRAEHAWLKLHIMVGTLTHVVTGAKVSSEADCPLLPELLATTAKTFRVREVSADKAYLSKKNLEAIDRIGAVPFIPFKSNSIGMASKSEPWRKMWCLFSLKSEEFRVHYHRRSNVESTMWMIKSKFGGAVRSRLPVAQVNEILAKLVCHNLACIVRAVHEFGIDGDLGGTARTPTAPTLTPVQP